MQVRPSQDTQNMANRTTQRTWPSSASKVGYSDTSNTPALMSWLISHFSGLVIRLPGRRVLPACNSSGTSMVGGRLPTCTVDAECAGSCWVYKHKNADEALAQLCCATAIGG